MQRERNNCGRGNLGEYPDATRGWPSCTDGAEQTAEVGSFPPNAVGLHDVIGNVAEFVLSCRNRIPNTDNYAARSDGALEDPSTCDRHLVHGGVFYDYAWAWYGAFFFVDDDYAARRAIGFRVLLELDEDQPDAP